ncbi:hypothetical protein KORDIASMS9_03767 [Kordia sp. SMS9]|uniref:hypothetical protein n=1 Tax=Kordia sp. SMS9 TaxID=2282170 RepID=UPI000E0CD0AC|nr:hypothetical protein [Kordia sp. SMS9]AXG71510.1 hypothetical protein KORDIASMS9_03767 [Kordia sp. SMS9]
MEKLSLDKFKDCQISVDQVRSKTGGGSSCTETCTTSGWDYTDTQTDIYSDNCDDGVYTYVCSYTKRGSIITSEC